MRRGLVAAGVGALLASGAVLGLAAPASAHNYMISSTPVVNGTLTTLPKDFEITTNDKLLNIGNSNSGFAYRIVGPNGRYYDNGCLVTDGPSMTTKAALGPSGVYTIRWQIISADGHTVSDSYTFTWKAPAGFTPAASSKTPPVCATSSGSGSSASAGAPSGDAASSSSSSSSSSDVIWIGAGVLILVALGVTVALLLRKPRPARDPDANDDDADLD
jgi:copper resistance protein C